MLFLKLSIGGTNKFYKKCGCFKVLLQKRIELQEVFSLSFPEHLFCFL